MEENEQTTAARFINKIKKHKLPIAIVTTAAVVTAVNVKMQRAGVKHLNEFLTEHGLIEKFYDTQA